MNKSMNINALIEQCADVLFAKGYNEASIRSYQDKWRQYVLPFAKSQDTTLYSKDLGERFLEANLPGKSLFSRRSLIRCVTILTEYVETGTISRRLKTMPKQPLDGPIGDVAKKFIEYSSQELRLRDLTLVAHRRQLSSFICGLSAKGITELDSISENDVLDFLNGAGNTSEKKFVLSTFFKYLENTHQTRREYSEVIRRFQSIEHEKLPTTYTDEEISKILEFAKSRTHSNVGKRNYAIVLMACRLGMRSSDIRYLQFSHIDWDKHEIHLQQFKTGVDLRLPLLHDVGEAIINYIRYARPKSSLPYVFLTDNAPYDVMSATNISHFVGWIIKQSGVDVGQRHRGSHALRHSLATHMLQSGVTLPVISEVLGHVATSSTMHYIGVSRDVLLECALDIPAMPNSFYTQRGGIFYA